MKTNPRLLIALAVLLLSGCYANTVTSNQRIRKDGWLSSHANVRVVRETEVSDDLLRIDIDADGRILFGPTTGFRQQQVPAGAFVTITATATDPRAADFRLTLTNAG